MRRFVSCLCFFRVQVPVISSSISYVFFLFFFFQAEDGIRDDLVTGVQTCALPIWFQIISVEELKVPMVPYLEMGGSNFFVFRS